MVKMKGKDTFTAAEIQELERLIACRCNTPSGKQKMFRDAMREIGFYGRDDWGIFNLTLDKFHSLISSGKITIVPDCAMTTLSSPKIEKTENMVSDFKEGLAPWVGNDPKVLILGTLPGDWSLAEQAYYVNVAHNSFWKILRSLFPNREEMENREFVESLGIALWDCVKSGVRKNSTDAGFDGSTLEPNDVAGFLAEHPTIKAVVLNGKSTYTDYFCRFSRGLDCKTVVLSSTANTNSIPFEKKLEEWSVIKDFVG